MSTGVHGLVSVPAVELRDWGKTTVSINSCWAQGIWPVKLGQDNFDPYHGLLLELQHALQAAGAAARLGSLRGRGGHYKGTPWLDGRVVGDAKQLWRYS